MKRLKIGFLRTIFLPITERFIFDEIKEISNYIESHVFCLKNENFTIKSIHCYDKYFKILNNNYPFILKKDLSYYNQMISDVKKDLNSLEIDILHAEFGTDALFFLKVKQNLPLVVSFRGYDIYRIPKTNPEIYRILFKEADLFLVRSTAMKKDLEELGCNSNKIIVHHSAICIDDFHFEIKKSKPKNILAIGRLIEKKGFQYLIEAMKSLSDYRLNIIGDGPLIYENVPNVKFLGNLNHTKVIEEIKRNDIYVQPSITAIDGDKEGIPVSLMEAMASGLPVVASNHSGIPELVQHMKSGLIVDEKSTKDIIEKIRMLDNFELRLKLAKNAREIVEKEFSIGIQTKKLIKLYQFL